ncbi:MAG: hypothetical protein IH851_04630 [Armatimonadetes bacterium]|nr:hypothetical protein [Armatimonadota bacterium]
MRNRLIYKTIATAGLFVFAAAAMGGTLIVTSPEQDDFVGATTTISFRIEDGVIQVTVRATITAQVGGVSTTLETRVTPNQKGDASGSMTWSPSEAFPEGVYDIVVTATETGNPYNTVSFSVTLDRKEPEFTDFGPLDGSFIQGTVTITAEIDEPNIEEWRVTVNGQDIPDNTGSATSISVEWDTTNIEEDGPQTIKIVVKDKADNQGTHEVEVILDRAAPQINVLFPRSNMSIRPGGIMAVAIDVVDSASDAVDVTAIIVELRDMSNNLIRRVSRFRYSDVNDTTARWLGRVRLRLPSGVSEFKLVVGAVDKAGNTAVTQEVPLHAGRGRGWRWGWGRRGL